MGVTLGHIRSIQRLDAVNLEPTLGVEGHTPDGFDLRTRLSIKQLSIKHVRAVVSFSRIHQCQVRPVRLLSAPEPQ
jgi:hypothetical protein